MKKALVIIWTAVLIFTVYILTDLLTDSNARRAQEEFLKEIYQETEVEDGIFDSKEDNEDRDSVNNRFKHLLVINPDVVGWIRVSATRIDYPVLQGEDNSCYLHHNIFKEPSRAGAIFMDYRNNSSAENKNTIIYGHNMKDGSMFRDLKKFKDENFIKDNPYIEFITLWEETKWEVFSVYVTSTEFYYIQTDFSDTLEFRAFLAAIEEKSLYDIKVEITEEDRILTLSTCSNDFTDARLVIHAKRIL